MTRSTGRSDLVDLEVEIVHQTERAVLVDDGRVKVWLPKAVVELNEDGTITLPEAVAFEKGLL
jgi:hypothetical protein